MNNKIKLIVSSYQDCDGALSLIDIDLKRKEYKYLNRITLTEPSFVIGNKDIIFTYDKNHLKLKAFRVYKDIINNTYTNNKHIEILDSIDLPFNTLTHLAYNTKYNSLLGASYADGIFFKIKFNYETFEFNDLEYINQGGKCHCVTISEDKEYFYITNIEHDKIYKYDNNLNLINSCALPKGVGPRHSIVYDNKIFIITEYSNELYVYDINNYKLLYSHSTLNFNVNSYGGTLMFSRDYKYIYCSNRGEETISVFRYGTNIEYLDYIKCYGVHSRHMILSECGGYIISCNKNSNDITIIDVNNGELVLKIPYEKASCAYQII